jgi:hypothetical protein
MKPPIANIAAPMFPAQLEWVNVANLRMDQQKGKPVLIEFCDFARINSLHTARYMQALHEQYEAAGLRVVGVHSPAFEFGKETTVLASAVQRLGLTYPVVNDCDFTIWGLYGNEGWPARYLWDPQGRLSYFHYGEGDYQGLEQEIQTLLELKQPFLEPFRPEDDPEALLSPQTEDQVGAYSGAYEAGAVYGVFSGSGTVQVNGQDLEITYPGCYELVKHSQHTEAELELELASSVECHATCFTAGIAAE